MGCSPTWATFQANNARTGYVNRPSIDNPSIKWQTYIGIQGYLNNSIIAKNIYVGSSGEKHNESDNMDGIYCIDRKSGNIIWHFQSKEDACGVAYSNKRIYATGDDGYLRCLNSKNGSEQWSIKREGKLYAQPLIMKDKIIIGDESGTIVVVDKKSGKIVVEKKVANTNIRGALSSDGIYIYAAFVEGKVACLDIQGNIIWEKQLEFHGKYGEDFQEIYGAPTIIDNQVIITFSRSTVYDHPAVYAFDKNNGKLLWQASKLDSESQGSLRSSVAIWKEYAFYGTTRSNALLSIQLKDGLANYFTAWGEVTDPHYPSPVIAKNTLYLGRHDGGLNAIDLESQRIKWQLFLGNHQKIKMRPISFNLPNSFASRHGYPIPSIYATPSIDKDGTLYVGSGDGWLYAIANGDSTTVSNP